MSKKALKIREDWFNEDTKKFEEMYSNEDNRLVLNSLAQYLADRKV